jgi:hypothetical protein
VVSLDTGSFDLQLVPVDMKDHGELTPEEEGLSQAERAALEGIVWRKLDRWILPLCTSFFLLAFLDRTNIGNARVAGLQTSLGMSNYQYTVALTVTYVYVCDFFKT